MYDKSIFQNQIRRIMKERHVSQRELADMLGVQPSSVSRYVTGERSPDLDVLVQIANELKVSLNELLGADTVDPDVTILEKCYFRCKQEDRDVLWALLRRYMEPDEADVIFGAGEND